jgi:hypothetical protein
VITIDDEAAETLAILVEPALLARTLSASDDIYVSPKVAGRLTGRSAAAIRRAVDAGELLAHGRTHRHVNLQALSAWHQAPIAIDRLRPPQSRPRQVQTTDKVAGGEIGHRGPATRRDEEAPPHPKAAQANCEDDEPA